MTQLKFSPGRRKFLKKSAAAAAGIGLFPYLGCSFPEVTSPATRVFGRLGFNVTTLGLGGQASIQWTPEDVDPVAIILKAFQSGINYFDTSNLYGPSQSNFGKAFRKLGLIPGQSGYNEKLRESIFLTSKTHLRYARGGEDVEGLHNWTNGPAGFHTVDDLKRTLSLIYGDGKGNYPRGAYLNMVLIHSIAGRLDIDAVYEGLYDTDPKAERIGALAALRDYRDGSNLTGLNPGEEKLVRHVGFSGHYSPALMMEMIRRDKEDLLDGMLVAINSNDLLNFNMQYNVIPVAAARNMGVIAMKVFADGAMYTKEAKFSRIPEDVVRTVGSRSLPSDPLIKYALATPGVHTAITGIGQIDEDPARCQLKQNLAAAQVEPDGLSESDRKAIEEMTSDIKDGKTNYFQVPEGKLTAPVNPVISQEITDGRRIVNLNWHSAYAGNSPIDHYEVIMDEQLAGRKEYMPQTTMEPFGFSHEISGRNAHDYVIITVDRAGRKARSSVIRLKAV